MPYFPPAAEIDSGTSFPGSPASAGDEFRRSDLGLDFRFDGTRWLSTQLFRETFGLGNTGGMPISATTLIGRIVPWSALGMFLEDLHVVTQVESPNSGADIWTVALGKKTAADAETTIASFTTTGDAVSQWAIHEVAADHVFDPSAHKQLYVRATKGGVAGAFYWAFALSYRLIAT